MNSTFFKTKWGYLAGYFQRWNTHFSALQQGISERSVFGLNT